MSKLSLRRFSVFAVIAAVFVSGCATTRAKKAEPADAATQIETLQQELEAKDRQIQDLQYQLESYQQALPASGGASGARGSEMIRVPGVSVKDVQRALVRAGFDPGPVDGRLGRKTKAAIKAFQRRNNLKADGIVGEKTWSRLK
jgi:peptidoglycan hydrolase-like protein with peptidoglycan-binding domain